MKSPKKINSFIEKDKRHHFHAKTNPVMLARNRPVLIDKAEGVYIYDESGRKIIDGLSGGWCTNIGYGNKRLCSTAFNVMQELPFSTVFSGKTNRWVAALSDKMASITPEAFQRFFFSSTGSDAVESALKMAFHYWRIKGKPDKRKILARELSYHGNTLFATSLSGVGAYADQFGSITDLIHMTASPYWYAYGRGRSADEFGLSVAAALERDILEIGADNIAAFIGEPIQASCNLIIPPQSYWPEVRRICDKYDILLIADEVVTGFGKTGHLFGFQAFDFEPDMFVLAKGFSSGYFPMSAVALGDKVNEVFQSYDASFTHGYTNSGHPVGSAVALENILVIEDEKLVEKVDQELGPYITKRLKEFMDLPCVGEVRSMGIIGAIEIDTTLSSRGSQAISQQLVTKVCAIAWEKGFHIRPVGTALGFMFPMIITKSQIDEVFSILKKSILEAVDQ